MWSYLNRHLLLPDGLRRRVERADLDFLKRDIAGWEMTYTNEEYQKKQMDADLDNDIDGVDISFVMLALAKSCGFEDWTL